jgi:hypothetical protein
MTHVNTALTQHYANEVHGIIGADILEKGKAIIDYNTLVLYLKKESLFKGKSFFKEDKNEIPF